MRRTYIEDLVVVIGGGVLIAVAWLLHWQAGIIVAAVVCMLIAAQAYRHSHSGHPSEPREPAQRRDDWTGAASWRHHGHVTSPGERSKQS